jgi:hypothetical protein
MIALYVSRWPNPTVGPETIAVWARLLEPLDHEVAMWEMHALMREAHDYRPDIGRVIASVSRVPVARNEAAHRVHREGVRNLLNSVPMEQLARTPVTTDMHPVLWHAHAIAVENTESKSTSNHAIEQKKAIEAIVRDLSSRKAIESR